MYSTINAAKSSQISSLEIFSDFSFWSVIGRALNPVRLVRSLMQRAQSVFLFFSKTSGGSTGFLPSCSNSDAVIKRLKKMNDGFQKKEATQPVDPFKTTFMDKTRANLRCGFDNREHSIRAKLQWFSESQWCQQEIERVVDSSLKASQAPATANRFDRSRAFEINALAQAATTINQRFRESAAQVTQQEILDAISSNYDPFAVVNFAEPKRVIILPCHNEGEIKAITSSSCELEVKRLEVSESTQFSTQIEFRRYGIGSSAVVARDSAKTDRLSFAGAASIYVPGASIEVSDMLCAECVSQALVKEIGSAEVRVLERTLAAQASNVSVTFSQASLVLSSPEPARELFQQNLMTLSARIEADVQQQAAADSFEDLDDWDSLDNWDGLVSMVGFDELSDYNSDADLDQKPEMDAEKVSMILAVHDLSIFALEGNRVG